MKFENRNVYVGIQLKIEIEFPFETYDQSGMKGAVKGAVPVLGVTQERC